MKMHKLEVHGIKLFTFASEENKKTKVKTQEMKVESPPSAGATDNPNFSSICELCGFVGDNFLNMAKHKKNEHNVDNLTCNQCRRAFSTVEKLKYHLAKVHVTVQQCDRCEFKTHDKAAMKKHKNTIHKLQEMIVSWLIVSRFPFLK